jgi:hypothetical protein
MRDAFGYLSKLDDRGQKPNYEKHLSARFARIHARAQSAVKKAGIPIEEARMFCAFPVGGIQENTVNRLLLMSSSERHLPNVPMAFFIKGQARAADKGRPAKTVKKDRRRKQPPH